MISRPSCALLGLFVSTAAATADTVVLADFENGLPEGAQVRGGHDVSPAAAAEGKSGLSLSSDDRSGVIVLPLPAGLDMTQVETVRLRARSPQAGEGTVEVRLVGMNEDRQPLFQRRISVERNKSEFAVFDEPTNVFRWWNSRLGDWGEVRQLALRVETPNAQVHLDQIELVDETPATALLSDEQLLKIAFKSTPRSVSGDGMLVATDLPAAEFSDADLEAVRVMMVNVRRYLARTLSPAIAKTNEPQSRSVLIFSTAAGRQAFLDEAGKVFRVSIGKPNSDGYVVQDWATVVHRRGQTARRPVILHEAVHAVVARDFRIPAGNPGHDWLQEGLASYIQVATHPGSIPNAKDFFRARFSTQPGADSEMAFYPLKHYFKMKITINDYPQAASLVAFLMETNPAALAEVIRAMADGKPSEEAILAAGPSMEEVQAAWLKWGRARFVDRSSKQPFEAIPELAQ